jgi:hypothetical protein
MLKGDPRVVRDVMSFLDRQRLEYSSAEEQHCDKLTVKSGTQLAYISIYHTGRIVIGGKDSPLRDLLKQMKASIETG